MMALKTALVLDKEDQDKLLRIIYSAAASREGVRHDGVSVGQGGWEFGLSDILPLMSVFGYYPEKSQNSFDDMPCCRIDSPEFVQQVVTVINVLQNGQPRQAEFYDRDIRSQEIAESITLATGGSMSIGAVEVAALALGYTLTNQWSFSDELRLSGVRCGSLNKAIASLPREVRHV